MRGAGLWRSLRETGQSTSRSCREFSRALNCRGPGAASGIGRPARKYHQRVVGRPHLSQGSHDVGCGLRFWDWEDCSYVTRESGTWHAVCRVWLAAVRGVYGSLLDARSSRSTSISFCVGRNRRQPPPQVTLVICFPDWTLHLVLSSPAVSNAAASTRLTHRTFNMLLLFSSASDGACRESICKSLPLAAS